MKEAMLIHEQKFQTVDKVVNGLKLYRKTQNSICIVHLNYSKKTAVAYVHV